MEKAKNTTQANLQVLDSLELGFDEVAKKRARKHLGLNPLENGTINEEDELLMFLLCRSVLY